MPGLQSKRGHIEAIPGSDLLKTTSNAVKSGSKSVLDRGITEGLYQRNRHISLIINRDPPDSQWPRLQQSACTESPILVFMMSPFSFITLGIILSFSVFCQCQNLKSFMEKHIVQDHAKINCNVTIKDRNLKFRNECRRRNTFIHDTNGIQIKELCSNIIGPKEVISDMSFKLTDCKLLKGSPNPPGCEYSQKSENGKVQITCENNSPVHFVTFVLSSGVSWSPCILTILATILLRELF
ncbi:angiogenin [Pelobates fuscus]|uniref:angiogenin n=1 Tax=Pelobates fuscus TaxID=191477 RepID=UPI002FE4B5A1